MQTYVKPSCDHYLFPLDFSYFDKYDEDHVHDFAASLTYPVRVAIMSHCIFVISRD